jgi:hypothetical protein
MHLKSIDVLLMTDNFKCNGSILQLAFGMLHLPKSKAKSNEKWF